MLRELAPFVTYLTNEDECEYEYNTRHTILSGHGGCLLLVDELIINL